MKIKKIIMALTEEDIMNFMKLQNKVSVKKLIIEETVKIYAEMKLGFMKVKFNAEAEPLGIENNKVYLIISKFNVLQMNIANPMFKKVFNYVVNSFTDIEGVQFEGEHLRLSIETLVEKYDSEKNAINLKEVQATDVKVLNGEVEVTFGGIEVKTDIIRENNNINNLIDFEETNKESYNEAEIALTLEEIETYKDDFDEMTFFEKIKKYGKTAGVSAVYGALILFYTYKDENVPLKVKFISIGALGYFIIPTDLIPDLLPFKGYADDILALITAIQGIAEYINDDIKLNAKNRLNQWFDNIDEKDLEPINKYI